MKKIFITSVLLFFGIIQGYSQNNNIFSKTIYNMQENIYIVMDFYKKNVTIKGQEFLGVMSGYLGDYKDSRKWYILDSAIVNDNTAKLSFSNDEGSEDLEATLTYNGDETYTLRQGKGSTLRIARNRKWHKLSKELTFTTKR